ncbi:MAG: cyclic nucleotide-binding domain-containing protein, partial [Lachnospiraceae bacterium]|nr:cyclic nucleotide-binding domain-containing protein [Lachnospiraceae bacterium]
IQVLKTTAYNDEYVCYEFSSDANYLFGEMAMLDEGLRSASIRTTSPCVVGVIQAEDFQNFCEKDLQAGYKLMWYLSRKVCGYLRKDNEDLVTLFQALLEEIERE